VYSWNSVKSIGKFILIDDGMSQIVRKLDRSLIINTFQSSNNVILHLSQSESTSLTSDTDYYLWDATLDHLCKVNVNRKRYEDGYLIPDCLSTFTYNTCTLSKSKHKALKPVESKSPPVFDLIHTDCCGLFQTNRMVGPNIL
jgi:hypothetical protein